MTITAKKNLPVTVYAMTTFGFNGTQSDLENVYPDIYIPRELDGDKEDLGADNYHFSVGGEKEMVMVDKGLLEALVRQCQDYSDNELVINPDNNKSFSYKDLNKLVMGMTFNKEVTGMTEKQTIDVDRRVMADNIFAGHDFKAGLVTDTGTWDIDGDNWSMLVYLEDEFGTKSKMELAIVFQEGFTNVKSISATPK